MDVTQITDRLKAQIDHIMASELQGIQDIVDMANDVQESTQKYIKVLERFSQKISDFKSSSINTHSEPKIESLKVNNEIVKEVVAQQMTKIDLVRKVIKENGRLTTTEVIEKCISSGMANNVTEEEMNKFKNSIRYILNDLKGQNELTKKNTKWDTPWVPTEKLLGKV